MAATSNSPAPLTPAAQARKKKINMYVLYTAAAFIAFVIIYLLFAPSDSKKVVDFNTELPDAEGEKLPDNKSKIYEENASGIAGQLSTLDEDFNMLSQQAGDTADGDEEALQRRKMEMVKAATDSVSSSLRSLQATQQAVRTDRAKDEEMERLRRENDELRRRKAEERHERQQNTVDSLLKAAMQAQHKPQQPVQAMQVKEDEPDKSAQVSPVPDNLDAVATSLNTRVHNGGFYGIGSTPSQKNTIKAMAYGRQTISDGQNLHFRLTEPMQVGGQIIPTGSILVGTGRIGIDRLFVSITSVEYEGVVTSVRLDIYDADGQQGIFVPNSMELEAAREVGAEVASSVGSSATSSMFTQQSAAEQIKTDVGRGVVQGTFRYIGKKMQKIKVTVQDKHKVFIVPQK